MKRRTPSAKTAEARRWARHLSARIEKILAAHPDADRDNIRHTLILLEKPPLERLQRSLIRGRAQAAKQRRKKQWGQMRLQNLQANATKAVGCR